MACKIEVGSPEWLDDRRRCVTATDAAAVMGLHPTITPLMKYNEKINGTQKFKTPAMQRGLDLEPEARVAFEQLTGHFVYADYRKHVEIPWMAASFDGINDQGIVLEIKCPTGLDHSVAVEGLVPEKYIPQVQHQMYVAGVDEMFYFSYNPNAKIKEALVPIKADKDFQGQMLEDEAIFYNCLQSMSPPEATERDCLLREDRKWLFKEEQLFGLIQQRERLEAQVSEIKMIESGVRDELIAMAEGRMTRGYRLKFNPVKYKGAIQYDDIPQLEGVDLEVYRKPETIRWRVDTV